MSSLIKLETELREVEAMILSCYDANTGEQLEDPSALEERHAKIDAVVKEKTAHCARILKDKFFDRLEDKIDAKIKQLQREKADLQFRKDRMELALHNQAVKYGGTETILDEEGKPEMYLTSTLSVTRSVPDISQVEGTYLKVKTKALPFFDHEYVTHKLINSGDPVAIEIASRMNEGREVTCLLSELPEDHPAIKKSIRPTISVTKTKPKRNDDGK